MPVADVGVCSWLALWPLQPPQLPVVAPVEVPYTTSVYVSPAKSFPPLIPPR